METTTEYITQDTKVSRVGNFSSSQIYKLMTNDRSGKGFGAPAKTYIREKNFELQLGRPITTEQDAKSTSWGSFVEKRAFDLIPDLGYRLLSDVPLTHKSINNWVGAPDIMNGSGTLVADIKCPWTLTAFCNKIEALEQGLETYKEEVPEDYWQLISNAAITGATRMEAIIYVPYKDELSEIIESAGQFDGNQNKIAFLNWATEDSLPYLIRGKKYLNLNRFDFEVPQQDVQALTERVKMAVNQLLNY